MEFNIGLMEHITKDSGISIKLKDKELFGTLRGMFTEENSEILEILTESFKNIFSTIPSDSISAMLPIKVLQVFFINHDYFISLMMK